MKKPFIGIVFNSNNGTLPGKHIVNETYVNAVIDAGGVPVCIPAASNDPAFAENYIHLLDGLLIAGGDDVCPSRYGQDPVPQVTKTDSRRDNMEFELARLAAAQGMPVFGICRGAQVVNSLFGGTLYQDLPSQKKDGLICHKQDMSIRSELTHSAQMIPGSLIEKLLGTEPLFVNTYHHQAIKDVAEGFTVSAVAPDGVVEAIESEKYNCYAVQWHPEELYKRYPRFKGLFDELIKRAADFADFANK